MTVLIMIVSILAIVLIYLALPGGQLHRQYTNDVRLSFGEAVRPQQTLYFIGEAIAGLPIPMQKYLSHCGYTGKPMMDYMRLDFKEAYLAISQEQNPVKIHYEQYNFVVRPDRHAFIDARMFGIPLNGKDTLLNGEGSMTIVLAKLFTLGHSTGSEFNQSMLVAALADAVMMPSLYLQDYVTWKSVDEIHAECTITWGYTIASGTFTFNEAGEIVRFDTNDRYQDNNGEMRNLPWTVEYGNYQEVGGLRHPGTAKIYWHMPDGREFTYFKSENYTVSYSVN